MQELNRQMMTLPELRELEEIIRFGTGPAAVSGVSGVHRAMLGAALRQETKRPLAVLCADEQEARRMAADLAALTGEECVTLFAREWQLRDRVSASHSFEQERLDALCRMAFGRTGIVVATVDGMMQRTLPPTALRDAVLTLRLGEEHDLRALAERLTAAGYVRCEQVEGAGQFAVRGGILDFYSPAAEQPVRADGGKPALAESTVQSADKRHTVIYAEQLRRAYRIHAVTQRLWRKQLRRTAAKRCRQALRRFAIALGQCAEARLRQRTNKRIGKLIQMSLPPLCRRCKHTVKLPEIVEADPDISGIIRSAAAEYHPAVIRHITLPIYHIARIRAPSRRQSAPYRRTKRRAARITCLRRGYPPQAARSCR